MTFFGGTVYWSLWTHPLESGMIERRIKMKCPKCGSENVKVQMVESGSKTSKKGTGLLGNLNNAARTATAVCTLGMSNIVWKKSKGTEKTKTILEKVCLCQNCGESWSIE